MAGGNVGKIGVRAGYDGGELTRGLRRSKSELEEFAKAGKRVFQFGIGEAGVQLARGGFEIVTAALKGIRGDTEAAMEAIERLPFGLGAAIRSAREFWKEFNNRGESEIFFHTLKEIREQTADTFDKSRERIKTAREAQKEELGLSSPATKRDKALDDSTDTAIQRMQELDRQSMTYAQRQKAIYEIERDQETAITAALEEEKLAEIRLRKDSMRSLKEEVAARTAEYEREQAERAANLADYEQYLRELSDARVKSGNQAAQQARAQNPANFGRRFGEPEDIAEGRKAGRDAVERIEDMRREERILKLRIQKKDTEADVQQIHDAFDARRRALEEEATAYGLAANKAELEMLKKNEALAVAERKRHAVRNNLRDISGQDLMLGGARQPEQLLRPMLGVLKNIDRRGARHQIRPNGAAPAFGGVS